MPTSEHPWFRLTRPSARPLVFAHRGGAGLRPENTLAAFAHALHLGVDGMELDLRLSKDSVPVVIHDEDLARTTGATGSVSAQTADELAAIDAGCCFVPADANPWKPEAVGVPSFRDVLRLVRAVPLIVELKGVNPRLAVEAVRVAKEEQALDRVCFAGFADETVGAARGAADGVGTSAASVEIRQALYKSYVRWPLGATAYGAFQVPECVNSTRIVSPRFIRHAHRAGLLVQVWTVNEETDMRRLMGWGVDGLITDRPDRALTTVALPALGHRPPSPAPR